MGHGEESGEFVCADASTRADLTMPVTSQPFTMTRPEVCDQTTDDDAIALATAASLAQQYEQDIQACPATVGAIEMGFEPEEVYRLQQQQIEMCGRCYDTADELLQVLLSQ